MEAQLHHDKVHDDLRSEAIESAIEEQTLFGELSCRVTSTINATAGLRVSHVRTRGTVFGFEPFASRPPVASGSDWQLLPSLAFDFRPDDDVLSYVRFQQSFRPGGLIVRDNATQELARDRLAAWEAGLRFGGSPNALARGEISLSYSRWTDIQADTIDTVGLPSTTNIGDGNIWTLEGTFRLRPLANVTAVFAGTLNRSRMSNADPGIIIVDDAPLPNVPRLTARAGVEYLRSLGSNAELQRSAWARYIGKSTLGIGPILDRKQGNFVDTGLEMRIGSERRFLFLRGTNLLDTIGNRFAFGSVFTLLREDQITPLRPRTIRLGLTAGF